MPPELSALAGQAAPGTVIAVVAKDGFGSHGLKGNHFGGLVFGCECVVFVTALPPDGIVTGGLWVDPTTFPRELDVPAAIGAHSCCEKLFDQFSHRNQIRYFQNPCDCVIGGRVEKFDEIGGRIANPGVGVTWTSDWRHFGHVMLPVCGPVQPQRGQYSVDSLSIC